MSGSRSIVIALQDPERLAQLVAHHPVEALEAPVLQLDCLLVGGDERVDRRLQEHGDALVEPLDHLDALAGGRRQLQAEGLVFHEPGQNLTENPVLLDQLVERRALRMAEMPELLRLGKHRRVGADGFLAWIGEVRSQLQHERRNVVEKRVGREHVAGLERQQVDEAGEPPGRDGSMRFVQLLRDESAVGSRSGAQWAARRCGDGGHALLYAQSAGAARLSIQPCLRCRRTTAPQGAQHTYANHRDRRRLPHAPGLS